MKLTIIAGLAAVALSGCASAGKVTPEQTVSVINALAAAGCKTTIHVGVGGATGQLGGGFHAENSFDGTCDPSNGHGTLPVAPAAPAQ